MDVGGYFVGESVASTLGVHVLGIRVVELTVAELAVEREYLSVELGLDVLLADGIERGGGGRRGRCGCRIRRFDHVLVLVLVHRLIHQSGRRRDIYGTSCGGGHLR